ncbi:MAG: endonuclease III [Bdellovibrionaceae bacterium]|nr:endonuclease III [Pseudobdellovibrionaceae bacterium]
MSRFRGRESKVAKKQRILELISLFQHYYPEAHCALNFSTPHELLIATILSAQCTDERVNIVTETLFRKYPTPKDYAEADIKELEEDVRTTGFFRNKAKNIKACCQALVERHGSLVPEDLDQLVALAGVGRKTANVVLGNAFNIASGVVVDTHVTRLSNRLGLVKGSNAEILERELNELVPQEHWVMFSHWLISHGRAVCKARKAQCEKCFVEQLCPQRGL